MQDEEEADNRPQNPRVTSTALNLIAEEMQEVKAYKTVKRGEPPTRKNPSVVNKSTESQRKRTVIHAFTRANSEGIRPSPSNQKIPSFNGFQATLHKEQEKSKAYYHKSYDQSPNKPVVNDVMDRQTKIMEEKKMPFSFVVGDQPVYTLMMELKAENPEKYKNIIPFLGPFHTQCVMMSAIFKRYEGSEFEEVLIQAGVVAAGSVKQALTGKHFRRGLRCFRLFSEALISKLLKDVNLSAETKKKLDMLRDTTQDQETRSAAHEALMGETEISDLVNNIFNHVDGSDMADYWKDFLDMTDALMQSVHACHTVDFDEYVSSVRAMLPWIYAYDKQNYGRWLSDFWVVLINVTEDQLNFLRENFAQSVTGNPYSSMAWCMWIECTMNKGSKMKSGWLSILKNEKQLLVHSRNVNNIARIRTAHNAAAKRKAIDWKHTECHPKRRKLDEECVQNILDCLQEFEAYPFDPDFPILRTMQSGVPAPPELVKDFKSAGEDGENNLETHLQERVYSKTKSIHAKMKKMNRKTFATTASSQPAAGDKKMKIAEIEQAALKSVINLVDRSEAVELDTLLDNRVTEECITLFNPDGTFRKNSKCQLITNLNMEAIEIEGPYTAIVDMGMVWRLALPKKNEKSPNSDDNFKFKDYGEKVADLVITRHPNADRIICTNDPYESPHTTKDDERDR